MANMNGSTNGDFGFERGMMSARRAGGSRPNEYESEDGQNSSYRSAPAHTAVPPVNDMEQKRLQLAMLMAGRGMTGFSQGMNQGAMPGIPQQSSPFDIYGNPIGG